MATKRPAPKTTETHGVLEIAIRDGNYRAQLEALRNLLAHQLETADTRDVATLARQLFSVCREIESLPPERKSALDDLAERRRARREARVPAPSAVDVDGGTGGD